ncbi:hypothetical protein [Paenibacillus nasutitermitis]|uniref:Uncharacterized protein n=1 Tax=Paenibacillus nasutitermitis TaxID=1652958 RepID=A0A916YL44_9BACL|nr:hypothetical protein [Paenibacillus nasutitermitis]GGD49557.1 hypothetical protein GCM10010911_03840 [Paenibacillus nasutitermitis]
MKKLYVKNYKSIVRNSRGKVNLKGKVTIKGCGGSDVGGVGDRNRNDDCSRGFRGPSLKQRLCGWAEASTLVTVSVDHTILRGRVISVDDNGFEMTITHGREDCNDGNRSRFDQFPAGAIVFITFRNVNAIAAGIR